MLFSLFFVNFEYFILHVQIELVSYLGFDCDLLVYLLAKIFEGTFFFLLLMLCSIVNCTRCILFINKP